MCLPHKDDEMGRVFPRVWPTIMARNGVTSGRGWWGSGGQAGSPERGLQAPAVSRDSSFDELVFFVSPGGPISPLGIWSLSERPFISNGSGTAHNSGGGGFIDCRRTGVSEHMRAGTAHDREHYFYTFWLERLSLGSPNAGDEPGDLVKAVVATRGSCLQRATDEQPDSGLGVS